jgi:hypothetical protein
MATKGRQKLSNSHPMAESCRAPHQKPSGAYLRETLSTKKQQITAQC